MKTLVAIIATFILTAGATAPPATAGSAPEGAVVPELIEQYQRILEEREDPTRQINAITNNGIKDLSLNRELLLTHNTIVNHSLKSAGITNQKGSGRCWMFAGFNVFTPDVATRLKLSKFELSQAWLAFWDKMEKSNLFLEEMIRLADQPLNDRVVQMYIESPIGDGGWWHYFTDLVGKYGVVPKSAMPETKQSSSTGRLNRLANSLLRGFASELREMHEDGASVKEMRERKEAMMGDIYHLLVYTYGEPPTEFTFRYEPDKKGDKKDDKDESDSTAIDLDDEDESPKIVEETFTPLEFYHEYFGGEMPNYVALCNNPTREYGTLYQIETSRNMYEMEEFTILNLPVERLKHYSAKSLLDSQVVWFACDVGKQNYNDSGVFMEGIYDYNRTFGLDFKLTKRERIAYMDMSPNHAMVLMGVDTAFDGAPVKWLVENSWGAKKGDKGNWYMYDSWFDEYVLVTIVDKRLMEEAEQKMLKQKPTKVEAWDPFFLALRRL